MKKTKKKNKKQNFFKFFKDKLKEVQKSQIFIKKSLRSGTSFGSQTSGSKKLVSLKPDFKKTERGTSCGSQTSTSKSFFGKVLNFVKYHNAFTIGIVLLFVFSATIFASEGVRDTVIGEKTETRQGTDNSVIINKNLDSFDPRITVVSVTQDEKNYYIEYNFNTVGIKENKWENIQKERILTISKEALRGKDLGLYVQKELSQVIDNELVYLKEVQKAEKEKGQTEILTTTEYTGLVGLALNIKDKTFSNYKPVIKPAEKIVFVDNNKIENTNNKSQENKDNSATPSISFGTANLNGITLYDQNSNAPFCISIVKGAIKTLPGECGNVASVEEPSLIVEEPIIEQPEEIVPEETSTTTEEIIEEPIEEAITTEEIAEEPQEEAIEVVEELTEAVEEAEEPIIEETTEPAEESEPIEGAVEDPASAIEEPVIE
jgi:hypothetical protein